MIWRVIAHLASGGRKCIPKFAHHLKGVDFVVVVAVVDWRALESVKMKADEAKGVHELRAAKSGPDAALGPALKAKNGRLFTHGSEQTKSMDS